MNFELARPTRGQLQELIDIRLAAIRPSLLAIDRYDPQRAATRFSKKYEPEITTCILVSGKTVGFYVLAPMHEHLLLDHRYIRPQNQSLANEASIINSIKALARTRKLPVRLEALDECKPLPSAIPMIVKRGKLSLHKMAFDHYRTTPLTHHHTFS